MLPSGQNCWQSAAANRLWQLGWQRRCRGPSAHANQQECWLRAKQLLNAGRRELQWKLKHAQQTSAKHIRSIFHIYWGCNHISDEKTRLEFNSLI